MKVEKYAFCLIFCERLNKNFLLNFVFIVKFMLYDQFLRYLLLATTNPRLQHVFW